MKKHALLITISILMFPLFTSAQLFPYAGLDSTIFTFSTGDSLIHSVRNNIAISDSTKITIDTSSSTLWEIGNTLKPVFSNGTTVARGIMTDTLHPYPKNANDFFLLKINADLDNFVVKFWHKYETDSFHAGGMVEYSTDSGLTWMNIAKCYSIATENFYTLTDTISSGDPAFTGIRNQEQLSSFQFTNCVGEKQTGTSCAFLFNLYQAIYLRFRFVSDTSTDTLSGWIIDSIRVESEGCPGSVPVVNKSKLLNIYPNPSYDGTFNFPVLDNEQLYKVDVYNSMGMKIISAPYQHLLNLSNYPAGLYYYRASNGSVFYSGNLLLE